MSKLFPVSAKRLQGFLKLLGFKLIRQKGSHQIWQHTDGRSTVLPVHPKEDIGRGLLHSILNQIEVSVDDYLSKI
jgi:predicted RNA binding protein YcfA (HicA-like mRNA interferase family)